MDDDFTITFELALVASNINKLFLVCLIFSFHLKKKYEEKKPITCFH